MEPTIVPTVPTAVTACRVAHHDGCRSAYYGAYCGTSWDVYRDSLLSRLLAVSPAVTPTVTAHRGTCWAAYCDAPTLPPDCGTHLDDAFL